MNPEGMCPPLYKLSDMQKTAIEKALADYKLITNNSLFGENICQMLEITEHICFRCNTIHTNNCQKTIMWIHNLMECLIAFNNKALTKDWKDVIINPDNLDDNNETCSGLVPSDRQLMKEIYDMLSNIFNIPFTEQVQQLLLSFEIRNYIIENPKGNDIYIIRDFMVNGMITLFGTVQSDNMDTRLVNHVAKTHHIIRDTADYYKDCDIDEDTQEMCNRIVCIPYQETKN